MSSDRIMAEEPIEKKITRILIHRKMTVTAAESCTGGLVAGTLVNADGISEVFKESYVTYSNEAKHKLLGVKKETLEKYGAVSRQTAAEMAEGAVRAAGADACCCYNRSCRSRRGNRRKTGRAGLYWMLCKGTYDSEALFLRRESSGGSSQRSKRSVGDSILPASRR